MKSTRWATLSFLTAFAVTGCANNSAVGPLFCDVERRRDYSEAELTARAPFPDNLRADLATNERGREWCGW